MQHIEKMRAHPAERCVLLARQRVRRAADQDHKEGDERTGQQQNDAGQRIEREYDGEDRERHEHGKHKLRQVLAVVRLQRFDAFNRGGRQFAGALAARVRRTQRHQAIEDAFAQIGLDAHGNPERGGLAAPRQRGARGDDRQQNEQRAPHVA